MSPGSARRMFCPSAAYILIPPQSVATTAVPEAMASTSYFGFFLTRPDDLEARKEVPEFLEHKESNIKSLEGEPWISHKEDGIVFPFRSRVVEVCVDTVGNNKRFASKAYLKDMLEEMGNGNNRYREGVHLTKDSPNWSVGIEVTIVSKEEFASLLKEHRRHGQFLEFFKLGEKSCDENIEVLDQGVQWFSSRNCNMFCRYGLPFGVPLWEPCVFTPEDSYNLVPTLGEYFHVLQKHFHASGEVFVGEKQSNP